MARRYLLFIFVFFSWFVFCALTVQPRTDQPKWEAYSLDKVKASLAQHKPVIIDYSAEWCPGCYILDEKILTDPRITGKLAQITTLRVDATDMESPQVQTLIDQYQVVGLPTVLFLDAKGNEIKKARIEGAGPVEEFLQSFQWLAQENQITFKENKGN